MQDNEYKVPLTFGEDEVTERRSRFIGRVWPVSSENEALEVLSGVRAKHRDASHNVYAYRLKKEGVMRYSDDGEPSGTAGMPLLEVFLREDIYDFLCVSTRYFGGVLLGAGGLVRAYSHSARLALTSSGIAVMRVWTDGVISCPYGSFESLRRILASSGAKETDVSFSDSVDVYFSISASLWDELCGAVTEFSAGTLAPISLLSEYRPG